MWQNFATALGLLAVAMLSALYSSAAARDGRILPAGISAVTALAIALWVGIRFVPRLAANVEWDWLPLLANYHVTTEGWIYFGAVTIVVFAAINTNNNLLYMVLSALMAVLLLSGFLSAVNFRGVNLGLRIPEHCFAGETFSLSVQLHNQKKVFPTFSLTVDSLGKGFRFRSFYVPCLRAQTQSMHVIEGMFRSRGKYRLKRVKLLSRYPFGFFVKGRECYIDTECICYPELIPQEQIHLSAVDILGSQQRFERGFGNDLYMIRDYLPSDSARHVHWKASAKTATLKTREFAAEESRRITICLDRCASIAEIETFERLVSYAASLVVYWTRDGIEIALVSDEWSSGFGNSETHMETVLAYLATVQPAASPENTVLPNQDGMLTLSVKRDFPGLAQA
jgi:uncharacterized protein (DUF58 family)